MSPALRYRVVTDAGELNTADYLAARDFLAEQIARINPRDPSPTRSATILARNAELAPGTDRKIGGARKTASSPRKPWASIRAERA